MKIKQVGLISVTILFGSTLLLVAVEKSDFTGKCLLGFEKSNGVPDSMSTINKRFRQGGQESEFGRGQRGPGSQDGEFSRSKRPKIGNRKIGKNLKQSEKNIVE